MPSPKRTVNCMHTGVPFNACVYGRPELKLMINIILASFFAVASWYQRVTVLGSTNAFHMTAIICTKSGSLEDKCGSCNSIQKGDVFKSTVKSLYSADNCKYKWSDGLS